MFSALILVSVVKGRLLILRYAFTLRHCAKSGSETCTSEREIEIEIRAENSKCYTLKKRGSSV